FHRALRVSVGGAPRAMVWMLEHIAVKWNQCERVVVIAAYSDPAIPACCTTLPQRTVSDLTKSCSPSIDRFSKGSMPSLRISVSISGSARMSRSSPWSFATISRGVLPGATIMCQPGNAPNAGRPASAIGGISGNAGTRVLVVTPRGRTLPACNIPTAGGITPNNSGKGPGTTSVKGGRAAFVGDVRHRDARGAHQELGVEMMRHARPDRCERELPWPRLRVCDQLRQRMDGKRRIYEQYERHAREAGERNEIGWRIVGKLLVKRDIDRHRRARRHEQHVSVGSGFGDGGRPDDGARPGPILDHEGLAEALLQPLGQHAGDDVGAAARREGHDDGDGARRVILRPRQR